MVVECLKVNFATFILFQDFVVGLAGEGRLAQDHHVEDDSEAEEVADAGVAGLRALQVHDLRSHVSRSAAPHEHQLPAAAAFGQPEVSNHALETALRAEDDVFGLQVAVHDVGLVHGFQAGEDALHDGADLLRGELVLALELVQQLPARQQFDADVERVLALVYALYFHEVLVVEQPHDFYLIGEGLQTVVLCADGLLGEGLDGVVLLVLVVLDEVDRGEGSAADFLDGTKDLVEAGLLNVLREVIPPGYKVVTALQQPQLEAFALLGKFDRINFLQIIFSFLSDLFPEQLEDHLAIEFEMARWEFLLVLNGDGITLSLKTILLRYNNAVTAF